jgi:urocanate hydratase
MYYATHDATKEMGAIAFDYGNNIRARAREHEIKMGLLTNSGQAVDFPGFVPAYIGLYSAKEKDHSMGCLSGDPNDIAVTDEVIMNISEQRIPDPLDEDSQKKISFRVARESVARTG